MFNKLILAIGICPALALAQGVPIKSGSSTDLLTVNTKKAILTTNGNSDRPSYTCSSSAMITSAAYSLSLESSASTGFKIARVCVGITNATAAAGVTVSLNRRSTASTGGALITAESTTADSVSKMNPNDANFAGICRRTGTLGTVGPTLDQWSFQVGELGAGAADPTGQPLRCKEYGERGMQMPTVLAGTSNGISVNVSSAGAGALSFGSISIDFIVE